MIKILTHPEKGCWLDTVSNEEYHADTDFVSSTQLKDLINECPAVFNHNFHNRKAKKQTDAMMLSSLIHHRVLEGEDFKKRHVVKPKFSGTGAKKAKEKWEEENKDKVCVTGANLKIIEGAYEAIMRHPNAQDILATSRYERSGYYIDEDTGIPCRIRYDSYDPDRKILADIKAVRSCKAGKFSKQIEEFRWDLSMAMYGEGIRAIDGEGPENYVFITVEKTAPYQVAVYEVGERTIELGLQDYKRSLHMLKDCIEKNEWPDYQSGFQAIDLPERFLKANGIEAKKEIEL